MPLSRFRLPQRRRLLDQWDWCGMTGAALGSPSMMIQFQERDRENLRHSHYRRLCSPAAASALFRMGGGVIKYNSVNYGLVQKLDGSWISAPKEEQHEVKIGGLLPWCSQIIIGMETNFRVREKKKKKTSQAQTVFIMQHSSLLMWNICWFSLREGNSCHVRLLDRKSLG